MRFNNRNIEKLRFLATQLILRKLNIKKKHVYQNRKVTSCLDGLEDRQLFKNIDWIFSLKDEIPFFLGRLKGKRRNGFFQYSLSGDLFGERIKWGLGNCVFFLKIIYTLNLEKSFKNELLQAIQYILTFQKKNGMFYDPLITFLSLPTRFIYSLRTGTIKNLFNNLTHYAETRQTISALSLFGIKPKREFKKFPRSKPKIEKFLNELNWKLPWKSGSHFSHLLFFLNNSNLKNKTELIDYAIEFINKLQSPVDGFWYKGNPSLQQKINGAMKIITGLKAVNKLEFKFPKKIIDTALIAINDKQACDNFNIIYTLKYCNSLTDSRYRFEEIKDFALRRLNIYKSHYHLNQYGFSFFKKRANQAYYGTPITRGRNEPDIHGTVMFLWGIAVISQILDINERLQFKEFIT